MKTQDPLGNYKRAFIQGLQRLAVPDTDNVFNWASKRHETGDFFVKKLLDTVIFGPPEYFGQTVDELKLQRALSVAPEDKFHAWLLETYRKREPYEVFLLVRLWWRFHKEQNLLGQGAIILRLRELSSENV